MGYSARYHATSLIAVFLALAIGILIGAEFGGDALTDTRKNLEHSLTGNLQDARDRADELSRRTEPAPNEFAERVYPALVARPARGPRIGVVALGGLPGGDLAATIEEALEPDRGAAGRRSASCASRSTSAALAGDLSKTRFADIETQPRHADRLGIGVGRQLGPRRHPARASSAATSSRAPAATSAPSTASIVVRDQPEDMGAGAARRRRRGSRAALMTGSPATADAGGRASRRSDAEPSSISFFQGNDLSSVDDVDLRRRAAGDGLRAARRRGQLRRQGHRRPPAARPARPRPGRQASPAEALPLRAAAGRAP